MNLDSRIKDILYIADCFTTETYKKYVGTECYMTSEISDYSNLDKCIKAVLRRVEDDEIYPYKSDKQTFQFCLAPVFVEQKKPELRPFTLSEFNERFEYGEYITFRLKDRTRSFYVPYNGNEYRSETEGDPDDGVHLGAYAISLQDLFNDYEYWVVDGWKPFGVEKST